MAAQVVERTECFLQRRSMPEGESLLVVLDLARHTEPKEFVYMVNYGMPEIETIKSATIDTAKLLGIDANFGSIEVVTEYPSALVFL